MSAATKAGSIDEPDSAGQQTPPRTSHGIWLVFERNRAGTACRVPVCFSLTGELEQPLRVAAASRTRLSMGGAAIRAHQERLEQRETASLLAGGLLGAVSWCAFRFGAGG